MVSMSSVCMLVAFAAGQQPPVMYDFTASWCGPCQRMRPAIDQLKSAGYPIQEIDFDQRKDLVHRYKITSVPTFVLVANGREVARQQGATSPQQLAQMFTALRPPTGAAAAGPPVINPPPLNVPSLEPPASASQASAPPRSAAPPSAANQAPAMPAAAPQFAGPPAVGAPAPVPGVAPAAHVQAVMTPVDTRPRSTPFTNNTPPNAPPNAALPGAGPEPPGATAEQMAMQATVRIQVIDDGGMSFATGTIVDTHGSEVLVLTCGHVFQSSKGKGQILVDTYYPGGPKKFPAQMVAWEVDDRDVAMITFAPPKLPKPAKLQPAKRYGKGDLVFSIGCDRGADPTLQMTRITSIDRYTGASNIEIAGQPVDGRSGGGLFTSKGELIGVCNAADPTDDEGIYAALPAIQKHLAANGMQHLLQPAQRNQPTQPIGIPENMLVGANANPGASDVRPAVRSSSGPPVISPTGANSAQSSAVSDHHEVIVVIRSRGGRDQVMSIKQPSPELMRHLHRESGAVQPSFQASSQRSSVVRGQNGMLR